MASVHTLKGKIAATTPLSHPLYIVLPMREGLLSDEVVPEKEVTGWRK